MSQITRLTGIKSFLFGLLLQLFPITSFSATESIYTDGVYPFLPSIVRIPDDVYQTIILPGFLELAQAAQSLAADIYGPQRLLREIPGLSEDLRRHPGYWPELVGKLGDPHLLRILGPDLPWLEEGSLVLGELNGGNPGTHEFITYLIAEFEKHPDWGAVPHDKDLYHRWAAHIRSLLSQKGSINNALIVWADECSVQTNAITVSGADSSERKIQPPFSVSQKFLELYRSKIEEAGMIFVSLVDDRGALRVIDKVLYLEKNGQRLKVDALITMADMESIDPLHLPQVERNRNAHRDDLNQIGDLIGIPGLIEAWIEQKDGGLLWDGPPKMLTRFKAWARILTQYIEHMKRGLPILPDNQTRFFGNTDGTLNLRQVELVGSDLKKFVIKPELGDSGYGILIAADPALTQEQIATQWAIISDRLKQNPLAYIFQPFTPFRKMTVQWPDGLSEQRIFDIRPVAMVSGNGPSFQLTMQRNLFVRMAPPGGLKITLKKGGAYAIGAPGEGISFPTLGPNLIPAGIPQVSAKHWISSDLTAAIFQDAAERAEIMRRLLLDLLHPETETGTALRRNLTLDDLMNRYSEQELKLAARQIQTAPLFYFANFPYLLGHGHDGVEKAASFGEPTADLFDLIREWRLENPSVKESILSFFRELSSFEPAHRRRLRIIVIKDMQLGADPLEISRRFKEDFEVVLLSESDLSDMKITDSGLFFWQDSQWNQVTSIVLPGGKHSKNIAGLSYENLARLASAGSLLVVNAGPERILEDPTLVHYMPMLRSLYLRKSEAIKTVTDSDGIPPLSNPLGFKTLIRTYQLVAVSSPSSGVQRPTIRAKSVSGVGIDDWAQQTHQHPFLVPVRPDCSAALKTLSNL